MKKPVGAPVPLPSDRRRYPRSRLAAVVVLSAPERHIGTCLVENLSRGGALLIGNPRVEVAEKVRLLLCLPGGRRMELGAIIHRRDVRGNNTFLAVRFLDVTPQTEILLDQLVRAEAAHPVGTPAPQPRR